MKRPVKRHEVVQPLDQSYRFIPLTQGQNAIVDTEDFERLTIFNWHAHWNPNTKSFYARSWSMGRIMMHKFILGYGPGKQADHINHNTLDNRKRNLRICSPMQNSQSRGKRAGATSKYKGVSRHGNKWRVQIRINKQLFRLGDYDSQEEAAKIYNAAAKEHFREFAEINP